MAGFRYNYTYVTSKRHNFITSLVMNIFPNAQQKIPFNIEQHYIRNFKHF